MFKRLLAWLCFFFIPGLSFAHAKADTLLAQWQEARAKSTCETDTANITLLNKLAEAYRNNDTDSSLLFAKQALQLAELNKLPLQQARSYAAIGMTNYVKGAFFESLEAASQLMAISQKINYLTGIANANQLRGLVYLSQDEYKSAIVEFLKGNKIYTRQKNRNKMVRMLFNIGLCYDEMRQPRLAFIYLDSTLTLARQLKNGQMISMTWNRMGETYYHTGQYQTALAYHNRVLDGTYQDNWENAFAFSGLAQSQLALKDYAAATANALKSYTLALGVNSAWDAARALKILTQCYAATGNFEKAYTYQSLMNVYNQNYQSENKQKQINYLQLQQQQTENLRLEKENQIHQQKSDFNNLLLAGIGILAVSIGIFAVFMSRSNLNKTNLNKKLERRNKAIAQQKEEITKQNEKLDQLNHTKNQLFSVISHDLRGPFASVMQTMEMMRSGDLDEDDQKLVLDKFYDQVSDVTAMVNNLLLWANSQQNGLRSIAYPIDITSAMDDTLKVSLHIADNKNISITHNTQGAKTVFADPDHIKIIMQNLVGNAIKFTPIGGNITISYTEDHCDHIISIKDTGIGIAPEKMEKLFKVVGKDISGYGTNKEMGAGIGLMLIKQFVDVNKGVLKINSSPGKGTEALIYLPKYLIGSNNLSTANRPQEAVG